MPITLCVFIASGFGVMIMIMSYEAKYWVILLAAGLGRRMRSQIPKQYLKIHRRPALEYSISLFSNHPYIEKITVALHASDKHWEHITIPYPDKINTVIGGKTRSESVMRGLEYLQQHAKPMDWILVHDAARPCLSYQLVNRLIDNLNNHPIGGLLGIPIHDSIKTVDDNHQVLSHLSQDHYWVAQTPQMFRYGTLYKSMKKAEQSKISVTDEACAIKHLGKPMLIVKGEAYNIKITAPEDLRRASYYLERH